MKIFQTINESDYCAAAASLNQNCYIIKIEKALFFTSAKFL
jgi:hypothetical protein